VTAATMIPDHLRDAYTMGGRVPVTHWWFDDSQATPSPDYTPERFAAFRAAARRRATGYYGAKDAWLYQALDGFPLRGQDVLVFGSTLPWYEAIALEFGAGRATVVEYGARTSPHPGLAYRTPAGLGDAPFDCALAISSFEHDGLGRYGDPLNPDGDLAAMAQARRNLVPGGLLYLAVPVGADTLFWNANRVYGRLRLPLLLDGWTIVAAFGFARGDCRRSPLDHHQPVFVLRNG